MSNINTEVNVISKLRQKVSNSAPEYEDPTFLATEPRFMRPIRGTSDQIKNFEEQFLIGEDSYTVQEINDDGDVITHKSFIPSRANPLTAEKFYRIDSTVYGTPQRVDGETNFKFDDTKKELIMPNMAEISFEGTILHCGSDQLFSFEDKTFKIYPNYDVKTQEDELWFVKANNPSEAALDQIKVLTKQILTRYETRTKSIIKEVITRGGENG